MTPTRGRHRRPRARRMSQTSLTVTASGAGLALPLIASGSASAQPGEAPAESPAETPDRTAEAKPAGPAAKAPDRQREAASATGTPATRATDSYRVVSGDSLSRIARAQDVDGGWQRLYDANREVIGDDPDLIFPGQRLSTAGEAAGAEAPAKPEPSAGDRKRTERDTGQQAEKDKAGKGGKAQKSEKAEKSEKAGKETEKRTGERASRSPSAGFSAPVPGVGPSTAYRASGSGWSSGYHTGVDFPVPTGTSVKAVAPGKVVSAGWAGAYGYEVVIRHADGRYSQYAHLSQLSVRAGRQVAAGGQIGRSGSTGNSTGPHLHFEVRTGPGYGSDIDPLGYLRAHGVGV